MNELLEQFTGFDEEIQGKLWRLLAAQAKRYTLGDSTSLPVEVMEELFRSLLYTLRFSLGEREIGALKGADENELLQKAQQRLEAELETTKALYRTVLRHAETYEHRALKDTLQNIGVGLERYDWRFFAHVPPGEIDYQLCLPVPDALLGVGYTKDYLWRLLAESCVLSRFDPRECMRLFEKRFPDYRELLVNLYEPVFGRALGLSLCGEPLTPPHIKGCDVSALPARATAASLRAAAKSLCEQLEIPGECRAYVEETAAALLPRYRVAAEHGALGNLF